MPAPSRRHARSALLLLLVGAAPLRAGTVAGTVTVLDRGGRPAPDASDVIVWVEGARARPRATKATVVMKGKEFRPRVTVVGVGSTVEFPNDDPIFHNAFSVSGENRFDLDLYKRPKSGAFTFLHPGVVRVYCNIHPQMSAVVVVRDNPYFTRAAADGSFTLEGVPAGPQVLHVWHERGGEATAPVTVTAEGTVKVPLTLDASSFKRVAHKNKLGKDYSGGDY